METSVVVDIECFRHRKEKFVVKEIAVYADFLDSIVIESPYNITYLPEIVQRSCRWLTANLHGLEWESGDLPHVRLYSFIESVKLRYPNSVYYAKGMEKIEVLSGLFYKDFIDLNTLGCAVVIGDTHVCNITNPVHSKGNHCARQKAYTFGKWLQEKQENELLQQQFKTYTIQGYEDWY
jgi:hypothetical protein